MKRSIIAAGVLLACTYTLKAQTSTEVVNNKFVAAMQANLQSLDTASTPPSFIMLANNFERIGHAEKKYWQPFYYAAFCYALMAGNIADKSKIDPLAEKATSYLAIAAALEKNNSEISSLQALIIYTRVLVDPISRWQTMGTEAMNLLAISKKQDPANPRPYLIEAKAKLYTPEAMGGGPKAAKASIDECLARFKSFVPSNSLAPVWGRLPAEKLALAISPR